MGFVSRLGLGRGQGLEAALVTENGVGVPNALPNALVKSRGGFAVLQLSRFDVVLGDRDSLRYGSRYRQESSCCPVECRSKLYLEASGPSKKALEPK
jgi:hypothetical protein